MKKVLSILMFFIMTLSIMSFSTQTYCDGWKDGYKRGYCYKVQNCIPPIVPICPIPKMGFDKYQDGYDRGFERGKKDQ